MMAEADVRNEYDRLAAVYDRRWHRYVNQTLAFLQQWSALDPNATVLDIGCGTGVFEQHVLASQSQRQIVSIDLSKAMLAVANQRCITYPHVAFQTASVTALPFDANSFDVVVSASAFHYFVEPLAALAEIKRVVKPYGQLVLLDWCRDYLACKVLDAVLQRRDPAHQRAYTEAELHHLLAAAGFKVVSGRRQRCALIWGVMIVTAEPSAAASCETRV